MRMKATLAIGFCVAFLCILSLLHVLEPEYNPPHLISEYQLGRLGWLMSLAFLCLGAASIALFLATRQHVHTRLGHLGNWGLLIIGVAYFVGGVFPPDRERFLASLLHGIGVLVIIFGSPAAFTLVSRDLAHMEASALAARSQFWTAALTWLGLSLFYGSILAFHASAPGRIAVGWANRFMVATFVLWLLAAALHVWSRSR